jgi:uncharacterized protein
MPDSHPPAVVLDTNAALDWLVFADPRIEPLAEAIRGGAVRWLTAPRLRAELVQVLMRPAFVARGANPELALTTYDLLSCMHGPADALSPAPRLVCRDPDDQVFLDLAIGERARWLITRDKALLELRARAAARGLRIAPPEAWAAD